MNSTRLIALLSLVAFLASQAVWAHASYTVHADSAGMSMQMPAAEGDGGGAADVHVDGDDHPSHSDNRDSQAGCCKASMCAGETCPPNPCSALAAAKVADPPIYDTLLFAGLQHSPPLRPPR